MSIREMILGLLLIFVLSSIGCASHSKRIELIEPVVVAPPTVIQPIASIVVESEQPKVIPVCSHLNEYAEPDPSPASFEAGKKAMYESFRNYLVESCMQGGCGIHMPQYYQLDINIAAEGK